MNASPVVETEGSDWSYWQADSVFGYGDGNPCVKTQRFGIIPPDEN